MTEMMNMKRNGSSQTTDPVIRNGLFETALEYARRKQLAVYSRSRQPEVLQQWYLIELMAEYIRISAFSAVTGSFEESQYGKRAPGRLPKRPQSNHIVTGSPEKINS